MISMDRGLQETQPFQLTDDFNCEKHRNKSKTKLVQRSNYLNYVGRGSG